MHRVSIGRTVVSTEPEWFTCVHVRVDRDCRSVGIRTEKGICKVISEGIKIWKKTISLITSVRKSFLFNKTVEVPSPVTRLQCTESVTTDPITRRLNVCLVQVVKVQVTIRVQTGCILPENSLLQLPSPSIPPSRVPLVHEMITFVVICVPYVKR